MILKEEWRFSHTFKCGWLQDNLKDKSIWNDIDCDEDITCFRISILEADEEYKTDRIYEYVILNKSLTQ